MLNIKKPWIMLLIAFLVIVLAIAVIYFVKKAQVNGALHEQGGQPGSSLEEGPNIFERQSSIEQAMYQDYQQDAYTFSDPYVALDPYGVSPLTALLIYESAGDDNVTITIHGDDEVNTIIYEYAVAKGRAEIPIIGLYPGRANNIQIINSTGDISLVEIETEPLPDDFSKIEVLTSEPGRMAEGLTLLSHFSNGLFAIDTNSDVRWWINDTPTYGYLGPIEWMENGHMLILGGNMVPQYYMQSVYEIDYLGKIYREYELPANSGHHEIRMLPNGNMLVAIGAPDESTKEDHIAEINMGTGEIVRLINFKDYIPLPDFIGDPVYLEAMVANGLERDAAEASLRKDWFHNNAFYFDKNDNSLILSARVLDAVFKIDYDSGELIWVFTDPEADWASAPSIKDKLLTSIGTGFEYPYGQHSVSVMPDGDLLLFDNGCFRAKEWDNIVADELNYSRAVRYRIDEQALTAEQVWQYGKERGNELLSCYVSSVEHLGDERYLINFGGQISGQDGVRSSNNMLADPIHTTTIIELNNNEVVYEISISGEFENTYRAYRFNIME